MGAHVAKKKKNGGHAGRGNGIAGMPAGELAGNMDALCMQEGSSVGQMPRVPPRRRASASAGCPRRGAYTRISSQPNFEFPVGGLGSRISIIRTLINSTFISVILGIYSVERLQNTALVMTHTSIMNSE